MTIDKAKLKELAEIMVRDIEGCLTNSEACNFQQHVADYQALTQPDGVLALLAEIERLHDSHEQVCANYNRVSFASEERGKQVDQLKAENDDYKSGQERYEQIIEDLKAENSQLKKQEIELKAENEELRKRLEGLVHVSDATGWEKHTCGEIAKARTLLGMEARHG